MLFNAIYQQFSFKWMKLICIVSFNQFIIKQSYKVTILINEISTKLDLIVSFSLELGNILQKCNRTVPPKLGCTLESPVSPKGLLKMPAFT